MRDEASPDQWGLPILPDPTDSMSEGITPRHIPKGTPPGHTFNYWVKRLSEVYTTEMALGTFVEMFQEAWADAYAKGVRDAKR